MSGTRTKTYFSKVQKARDLFNAKVERYVELHEKASIAASEKGDARPIEWALSHMADVNEKGEEIRPIVPSVDRQAIESGNRAPQIFFGIKIGGVDREHVIDGVEVKALPSDEPTESLSRYPNRQVVGADRVISVEALPQDVGAKVQLDDPERRPAEAGAIPAESYTGDYGD